MAEVTTEIKQGTSAVLGTARKHYIVFGVALLVFGILVFRYRNSIATWVATHFPSMKTLLGISTIAVILGLIFGAGDAFAGAGIAACCAKTAAHAGGHGMLAWLYAVGGAIALGMVAAPAPDVKEAKLLGGSKIGVADYTSAPGTGLQMDFYVDGSVPLSPSGRPLCATAEVVEVLETIEQVSTGTNPIVDDDLARTVESVKMFEPRFLGTLMDDTVGTGPIIKHLIEFLGLGFNRGSDAPVASITVPGSGTTDATYTRYFTIPHAQQFLRTPMASALWLAIVDQMKITVKLGQKACLDGVSTGAILKGQSQVRLTTPVVPNPAWHWPLIVQHILEQPVGGSTTFTLQRFGETNASGTNPTDFVFAINILSSLVGLGGNMTIDNIARIDCPKLGISDMENLASFVKARLDAQRLGRSPLGYDNNPNYVDGVTPTGMNPAGLKFLGLKQPGLAVGLETFMKVDKGFQLPVNFTFGTVPSGTHQVVISSMRTLQKALGQRLAALPGSQLPADPTVAPKPAGTNRHR